MTTLRQHTDGNRHYFFTRDGQESQHFGGKDAHDHAIDTQTMGLLKWARMGKRCSGCGYKGKA